MKTIKLTILSAVLCGTAGFFISQSAFASDGETVKYLKAEKGECIKKVNGEDVVVGYYIDCIDTTEKSVCQKVSCAHGA